ncbi:MAG: YhcH/YjgK/YiaL family protein [Lachnospiraceae bacterium]
MFIDKIENMKEHVELLEYASEIQKFINRCAQNKLQEGRYELNSNLGKKFCALVQKYDSKSKADALFESHLRFNDLQFILRGRERIYFADVNGLEIVDDQTKEADIIFYKNNNRDKFHVLTEQMMGYYSPSDAHMPCINWEDDRSEVVEKIVFKLPVI